MAKPDMLRGRVMVTKRLAAHSVSGPPIRCEAKQVHRRFARARR